MSQGGEVVGYKKLLAWQLADTLAKKVYGVGYLLEFSFEQKFLTENEFQELMNLRNQCGQLLWKLLKSQSS